MYGLVCCVVEWAECQRLLVLLVSALVGLGCAVRTGCSVLDLKSRKTAQTWVRSDLSVCLYFHAMQMGNAHSDVILESKSVSRISQ